MSATIHKTVELSSDPDASSLPFGEKLSETIVLLWANPSVYFLKSGPDINRTPHAPVVVAMYAPSKRGIDNLITDDDYDDDIETLTHRGRRQPPTWVPQ